MANSSFDEVFSFTSSWADRTDAILRAQLKAKGIGIHQELYDSLRHRVYRAAGDHIGVDFSFLMRGRFVDMGAGRRRKVENIASNGDIIRGGPSRRGTARGRSVRRPKKWYSKAFYQRLNALNGVVSARLAEQAIATLTNSFKR